MDDNPLWLKWLELTLHAWGLILEQPLRMFITALMAFEEDM